MSPEVRRLLTALQSLCQTIMLIVIMWSLVSIEHKLDLLLLK